MFDQPSIGQNFLFGANSQFTVGKHCCPIGETPREVDVVRGDDDGCALIAQLIERVRKLSGRLRIEAGGGLVEKQDPWVHRQRASESDTLALTIGKLVRNAFGEISDFGGA